MTNVKAIENIIHEYSYKNRDLGGDMEFVVGFVILEDSSKPITEEAKRSVDEFLSLDLGVWEIVRKLTAESSGEKLYRIAPWDIVYALERKILTFESEKRVLARGHKIGKVRLFADPSKMTRTIDDFLDNYKLSQFYCFIYYYDETGGGDEYIYSFHLPSGIREYLGVGEIKDSYEG